MLGGERLLGLEARPAARVEDPDLSAIGARVVVQRDLLLQERDAALEPQLAGFARGQFLAGLDGPEAEA